MGKKLVRRPLWAAAIAGAVVLVFLGTAAPALADDPPRASPAPRAGRAAPSGANYEEVINYAKDSARDITALRQQAHEVAAARNETAAQISTLAALTQKPSAVRDRLEREALRLSARPQIPSDTAISAATREAAEEMRTLRVELNEQHVALEARAVALAPYAVIAPANGAWMIPVQGELTQEFGPTSFWFEPAREYGGVYHPHFHEGIDIATAMYSPVVAAAPGRVVWVGHLPDGAMVVLIAHVGGLVSLYAHLDDGIAPPRVAAGEEVRQGQIIGAIGMTGMTTGPHVHFVVWRNGELIDPLSLVR
ncbi:MAG TPA: peptidoglycan DD-metalloendopeptidase family protein [Candidatus Limnocylindria bacterium]|nr:peptidoglycan DD-metalloendopeptidase family protein [Candidatus Limnocylindria bacterium]